MVPISIFLKRVAANKEDTEPRLPSGEVEVITSNVSQSSSSTRIFLSEMTTEMFSTCHKHFPILSSLMTYHRFRICHQSNTTGATGGTGTAYPSEAPKFTPGFSWVCVDRSLIFGVVFCRSLFIPLSFSFGHYGVCPSSIYGF
jgi:hypothetical protein